MLFLEGEKIEENIPSERDNVQSHKQRREEGTNIY